MVCVFVFFLFLFFFGGGDFKDLVDQESVQPVGIGDRFVKTKCAESLLCPGLAGHVSST